MHTLKKQGPSSQLVIGLALHRPVGWVLHSWVQSITLGIVEPTVVPTWYYGVAVPTGQRGQALRSWWREALNGQSPSGLITTERHRQMAKGRIPSAGQNVGVGRAGSVAVGTGAAAAKGLDALGVNIGEDDEPTTDTDTGSPPVPNPGPTPSGGSAGGTGPTPN